MTGRPDKEPFRWLSHCSRSARSYPRATSGPRSASSVAVPPEPEKTQELMKSHERLNRRSASVSGKCYQVTESGVTEPGLQANLLAPADDRAEVCDPGGLVCGSSKRQQPHRPQLPAIDRH